MSDDLTLRATEEGDIYIDGPEEEFNMSDAQAYLVACFWKAQTDPAFVAYTVTSYELALSEQMNPTGEVH